MLVVPADTPSIIIFNKLLLYERILTSDVVEVNSVSTLTIANILTALRCNTIW